MSRKSKQLPAQNNPYFLWWGGLMPLVGIAAFGVAYYRSESIPFSLGAAAIAPMYLPAVAWKELSD